MAFSVFQRAMSPGPALSDSATYSGQTLATLRRNTWHLRMDVGNHSEPELHASNPTVPTAPPTGDQHDQPLDPRPGVDRR